MPVLIFLLPGVDESVEGVPIHAVGVSSYAKIIAARPHVIEDVVDISRCLRFSEAFSVILFAVYVGNLFKITK